MDTTEQAAWDQRNSGPDLVRGTGPNRFAAEELTARLAAERGVSVDWVQADLLAWQPAPGARPAPAS